jgi:hypothetical protein
MIKFQVIKTDQFCLISPSGNCLIQNLLFDGEAAETTFHSNWYKIKGLSQKVERRVARPNVNFRFELKDKSFESKRTPLVLKCEDVAEYEDYYWEWKPEFENIKSLYALQSDPQKPILENEEVEWNIISTVPSIEDYEKFGYIVDRSRWSHEGTTTITNKDVAHPILDSAVFPPPLLPSRHSSLSSHQAYKIIRKHIQLNINPAVARIDGDYDFCFRVNKRISLAKPYETKHEVTKSGGKSYRPPKFSTVFHKDRDVKVFEMTHTGEGGNYKGYTPIHGFEGANEGELKLNIDAYLEKLMLVINEPLVECSCCQGSGVIDPTKTA